MAKHPCTGCMYWRPLNRGWRLMACHYGLDAGHSRGCPVEGCLLKTDKSTRRRFGNDGKEQGIALMRDGEWYYTTATGEYPVRSEVECWRELLY